MPESQAAAVAHVNAKVSVEECKIAADRSATWRKQFAKWSKSTMQAAGQVIKPAEDAVNGTAEEMRDAGPRDGDPTSCGEAWTTWAEKERTRFRCLSRRGWRHVWGSRT